MTSTDHTCIAGIVVVLAFVTIIGNVFLNEKRQVTRQQLAGVGSSSALQSLEDSAQMSGHDADVRAVAGLGQSHNQTVSLASAGNFTVISSDWTEIPYPDELEANVFRGRGAEIPEAQFEADVMFEEMLQDFADKAAGF